MKNILYIMSCNDGQYLKIGVCDENPHKRLKSLQTGNPLLIELVWYEERPNANKAENFLHHQLSKYRVRPDSEWFTGITIRDIRIKLMMFLDQQ